MAWRWPEDAEPIEGAGRYQWPAEAEPIERAAAPDLGPSPGPSGPPEENWLKKGYREYVAEPLTRAVSTAPRYFMGDLDVRDPRAGEIRETPIMSEAQARYLVPQTPAGGAAALASIPFGGTYLRAILAPALAAGGASALSGNASEEVMSDAAIQGAAGGVGKGLGDLGKWLYRSMPYVKDKIGESSARGLAGVMSDIDPAVGSTIASQEVSPFLKGGQTMAQMRQAATGGNIRATASDTMGAAIRNIDELSGQPKYDLAGPLKDAWDLVPDLVKQRIVKTPGAAPMSESVVNPWGGEAIARPTGPPTLSLEQAQMVRAYLGDKAFALSPLAQGLDEASLQLLRGGVTDVIESKLSAEALPLWRQANQRYGGTSVLNEFLNERNAKQGLPNRMAINENALSDYLDMNREDFIRRMGKPQFDAVVQDVLRGAQPGTRNILTPGAGTPLSALQQAGRGTNTGSVQAIGVPLRSILPGLGSEWTGRAIGSDPALEALLRYLSQKAAEEFEGARRGQSIPIGDTYGRR